MLDLKALLTKLVNHYNRVGTVITGSGQDVTVSPSSSVQTIGSVANIPSGTWLVTTELRFPSNNSGYRFSQIGYKANSASSVTNIGVSRFLIPASSTGLGCVQSTAVITMDETWTAYARGSQYNVSAGLSCDWYLKAVRLK